MTKLKAYSIVELIVVMLITTLVISFCYTALEFTTERNRAFELKQEMLFEHESFLNRFQKDLFQCNYIQKTGDVLVLHFDSTTREYHFGDSISLKMNNQTIPFKVKTTIPGYYFLGELQHIEKGFVDRISVSFIIQNEPKEVSFIKNYGADVLLSSNHEWN